MDLRIESNLPLELEDLVHRVIGHAIEVHRQLGPGFLESIYETAMCHELDHAGIAYQRQREILVPYKDIMIPGQRLDLLIDGRLIIELKALDRIAPIHEAQLLSYLKSTRIRVGLIINFRVIQLRSGIKRIVL